MLLWCTCFFCRVRACAFLHLHCHHSSRSTRPSLVSHTHTHQATPTRLARRPLFFVVNVTYFELKVNLPSKLFCTHTHARTHAHSHTHKLYWRTHARKHMLVGYPTAMAEGKSENGETNQDVSTLSNYCYWCCQNSPLFVCCFFLNHRFFKKLLAPNPEWLV